MMDKTKHTPGPWLAGQTITAPHPERAPGSYDRITIAQRVNRLADARLIAAAPDLLAALRECITEDGAACLQTGSAVALFRRLQTINDTARAAIAKARGE